MKKTILITGGSQGIGKATAVLLANSDTNIALTYASNAEKADEVVTLLKAKGANALALKMDLQDEKSVRDTYDTVEKYFGKVDVLVSNAFGTSILKPLLMVDMAEFDSSFALVRGTFVLLQEAGKRMNDNGSIVVVSSGATSLPSAINGLYAANKTAIEKFALSLAKGLGTRNINVNVVLPGMTETNGLNAPKHMIDNLVQQTPLGRLGQPEDVAKAIVPLVSDAGKWINMQRIGVNGGII
jgi:3-oxoacyl-[acyl-carrier protein] reductase